jgi:hypothetical protein
MQLDATQDFTARAQQGVAPAEASLDSADPHPRLRPREGLEHVHARVGLFIGM